MAYAGERIVLERRGQPIVAWIRPEDLGPSDQLQIEVGLARARRREAPALASLEEERRVSPQARPQRSQRIRVDASIAPFSIGKWAPSRLTETPYRQP